MLDLLTWSPAGLFLAVVGVATIPFLGVLVILTLALGVVAALGGAVAIGLYRLAQALDRRWRNPDASVDPATAGVSATPQG